MAIKAIKKWKKFKNLNRKKDEFISERGKGSL